MANVGTLSTAEQLAQYLGDGAQTIVAVLKHNLPPDVVSADDLSLYVAEAVHTKVEISNAAARPVAVIAKSNGTACVVKLYADDSDDVTVGTTDAIVSLAVSATSGELSAAFVIGAGVKSLAEGSSADGLTIAAPSTDVGTGAVTNDPTVFVLYA